MRIGVFDSGLGGLTVLKELIDKYPKNQYYYFGDNLNLPYGSKTKNELLSLASNIIDFLISKEVDIIVIACGTVSSNIYDKLSKKYNLPLYNVVDQTVNYINNSDLQKIGLIATDMTIKSKTFEKGITKEITSQACPLFVPLIEENKMDTKEMQLAIKEYLLLFKKQKIENLILGCTHYSIIECQINDYLKNNVNYINLGKVLANNIPIVSHGDLKIRLYFSKINHTVIENIDKVLPYNYNLEELVLE